MSVMNQGTGKGILTAALVGAAVGAGVALLFAPRSGKETRGWLARQPGELKARTASALEHGKEAARRAMGKTGKDAEEPGT